MTESWIPAARARLKRRGESRPTKIAGQIRALWPAIQSAIANGQSQKQICQWLNDEGIHISRNALAVYLSRIRKTQQSGRAHALSTAGVANLRSEDLVGSCGDAQLEDKPRDPLANLRERQQNRPGFNYDPEFKPEKLI